MNNKNTYFENKVPSVIVLIYFILLLAVVTYTDLSLVPPNFITRLVFVSVLFIPLIRYSFITPVIFIIFVTIRQFSVAPFGYIPSTSEYYLLAAIFIYLLNSKNISYQKKDSWILYLLLLPCLFSNFLNLNPDLRYMVCLLTFFFVSKLSRLLEHADWMELSFVFVSFVLSLYAIFFAENFAVETAKFTGVDRSYWTDPNYLGSLLSIGIVISIYKLFNRGNFKFETVFYIATVLSGFVAIGIIASRGAVLSIIVPIVYYIVITLTNFKKALINLVFIIILAVILVNIVSFDSLASRFTDDTVMDGSGRTEIWSSSIRDFGTLDFKMLLFGGGTNYALTHCAKSLGIGDVILSPHNNFLQILLDYGFVGFTLFLYFLIKSFINVKHQYLKVLILLNFIITCIFLVPLMYLPFWFQLLFFVRTDRNERL